MTIITPEQALIECRDALTHIATADWEEMTADDLLECNRSRARFALAATAPDKVAPVPDEVGWLVENGKQGDELRYRTMEQGSVIWTPDNMKALRFARRADAELFAEEDEDEDAWRIAEHMWAPPGAGK